MPASKRFLLCFIIAFSAIFLFLPGNVLAASIQISNAPVQLSSPEEECSANILLTVSVSDGTVYYLRGVFYEPGTSNYCGYTWNGNAWFKGPYSSNEGWKNFLKVTVQSASWSGQLKAKLDTEDTGCKDSGIYNFKIQRFTQNGYGTFDSQNEQTVEVIIPTPTPTPTPTPEAESGAEPASTPTPTLTPTPTPKLTLTPTPTKKLSPTPTPGEILGEEATPEGEEISFEDSSSTPSSFGFQNIFPLVFIGLGIFLMLVSGGFVLSPRLKKKYNRKKNEKIKEII